MTWRPLLWLKLRQWASSVAFSPDGSQLASGSEDGTISIWCLNTGACLSTLDGSDEGLTMVDFSPDGKWLASASPHKVKLWLTTTLDLIRTFSCDNLLFTSPFLAFSPDSKYLAWKSHTTRIYHLSTHSFTRNSKDDFLKPLVFLPNSKQLLISDLDGMKIWDFVEGTRLITISGHPIEIGSATIIPNLNRVATGSRKASIQIWDLTTNLTINPVSQKFRDYGKADRIAVSPNGKYVATDYEFDSYLRLWDTTTWECLHLYEWLTITSYIGFSADSKILIVASSQGVIAKWDATTGEFITTLRSPWSHIEQLAFSPDSTYTTAAWVRSIDIKIWNISTNEHYQLVAPGIHEAIAFSPDSKYVAMSSFMQPITIWDLKTHSLVLRLFDETKARLVTFSSDGSHLITQKGRIALSKYPELHMSTPAAQSRDNDLDVGQEGSWIVCNGRKCLWVPADYRSSVSAAMANNIVFWCSPTRMWMFTFDKHRQNKKRSTSLSFDLGQPSKKLSRYYGND